MDRLEKLRQKVTELYSEDQPDRAEMADWLFEGHVLVVADYAKQLAERYGANSELAQAGALLHDIADYTMPRKAADFDEESLRIARQLMVECGYSPDEIALTVDDAIRYHSCHGEERPKSVEGRVLATADSLAHLKTDFYVYIVWMFAKRGESLEDIKAWTLQKIERDLNAKIAFDEVRESARKDYEMVKELFTR